MSTVAITQPIYEIPTVPRPLSYCNMRSVTALVQGGILAAIAVLVASSLTRPWAKLYDLADPNYEKSLFPFWVPDEALPQKIRAPAIGIILCFVVSLLCHLLLGLLVVGRLRSKEINYPVQQLRPLIPGVTVETDVRQRSCCYRVLTGNTVNVLGITQLVSAVLMVIIWVAALLPKAGTAFADATKPKTKNQSGFFIWIGTCAVGLIFLVTEHFYRKQLKKDQDIISVALDHAFGAIDPSPQSSVQVHVVQQSQPYYASAQTPGYVPVSAPHV